MVGETSGLFWDARSFETALTDQEKALRDAFVTEYLKDYDSLQACIRIGFLVTFAKEFHIKLMSESYVLRRITELQRAAPADEKQQELQDKALILSSLRQATQNGPYNSRVAAAAKLAAIYGMDRNENADNEKEQKLVDMFKEFAKRAPV